MCTCAQDSARDDAPPVVEECLLVFVNAPPRDAYAPLFPKEVATCEERTFTLLGTPA
jgi:hypothetical protein